MGIDQKGDDVDQQCIGESVVYAPVSEPGLVDVEVIAMTILHRGRQRRRLLNAVTVLRHDLYSSNRTWQQLSELHRTSFTKSNVARPKRRRRVRGRSQTFGFEQWLNYTKVGDGTLHFSPPFPSLPSLSSL